MELNMNKLINMLGGYYPPVHAHKNNTTIIVLGVIVFLFCITCLCSSCVCSILQMGPRTDTSNSKTYSTSKPTNPIGGDTDKYGCRPSAGESYCEILKKCILTRDQSCPTTTHVPT
jgi:hypothetical protein